MIQTHIQAFPHDRHSQKSKIELKTPPKATSRAAVNEVSYLVRPASAVQYDGTTSFKRFADELGSFFNVGTRPRVRTILLC